MKKHIIYILFVFAFAISFVNKAYSQDYSNKYVKYFTDKLMDGDIDSFEGIYELVDMLCWEEYIGIWANTIRQPAKQIVKLEYYIFRNNDGSYRAFSESTNNSYIIRGNYVQCISWDQQIYSASMKARGNDFFNYEFIMEYRAQNLLRLMSYEHWRKKFPLEQHFIKADSIRNVIKKMNSIATGSGFALNKDYVVTNYHVIENAKKIKIYGIKGSYDYGYLAEVIEEDKDNDIAVLAINDPNFNGFGSQVPYKISTNTEEVGTGVFVLGYPMADVLGFEIKLTDGLISSKTGYKGDVKTYQISAPIQPGNSGGPLFSKSGNLIGITNAGIPGAENVGYAIKTSYLKTLVETIPDTNILPTTNTISNLSLTEKVKKLKNFVFLIVVQK